MARGAVAASGVAMGVAPYIASAASVAGSQGKTLGGKVVSALEKNMGGGRELGPGGGDDSVAGA